MCCCRSSAGCRRDDRGVACVSARVARIVAGVERVVAEMIDMIEE